MRNYPKPHPWLTYLFALWLTLFGAPALATLDLNGLAIFSELGDEQYMAALFLEEVTSDAKEAILSDQRKRMEVRVVANRLLTRKFKRLWIEGVAINSASSDMKKHAQNLADFSNMLKLKMIEGDSLSIERTFRRGVEVSLNGILLGTIKDPTFFDLLLRTWIGPVPPSVEFKQGLLGGGTVEPAALVRFESVRTTAARVSELSAAITARSGVIGGDEIGGDETGGDEIGGDEIGASALATARPATSPEPPTLSRTRERPEQLVEQTQPEATTQPEEPAVVTTPTQPVPELATIRFQDTSSADSTASAPSLIGETTPPLLTATTRSAASQTSSVITAAVIANSASSAITLAQQSNSSSSIKAAPKDSLFDEEESEKELTAADLLSRQLYINQLAQITSKNVTYPSSALRRGHEGSVRVDVTIDRSGKVIDVVLSSESEHASLSKAAVKAVKKASPYPKMPESIFGDEFLFSVPITFKQQPEG